MNAKEEDMSSPGKLHTDLSQEIKMEFEVTRMEPLFNGSGRIR